ncbi:hypothetical protein [Thermobifida cellulosilytica]|jgi:hypothetical protein|uniref:Uncharacterized protein n=1 Tax=Thermobifida cellulosilytica TB100 TaxID=665004 RepID=A0A147KF04_THECS|nr:hypothetical protein [Thermobifida cellulosilytica]KUP95891.1 hypothetical protein AC529_15020 [Thermobifida cellulosilytica TB100]
MNLSALQLADSVNDLATPGLLGFTVIALIGGALFLLMRSMRRHLEAARSHDFGTAEASATEPNTSDKPGDQAD